MKEKKVLYEMLKANKQVISNQNEIIGILEEQIRNLKNQLKYYEIKR